MTLETSTVQANEVVKAEDWDFGLTAQVKNIGVALASVLESRQSFVIGGKITPYAGGGLNLSIAPLFGVANSTLNNFLDTSKMEPIPVSPSPGEDRIDIVEAQGEWEEFDQQQRAFMDFETNIQTFQTIATKKRNKVNVRVKAGTPGSVVAPEVSDGWVKLAEIHIQADMVDITEDNIKNITADVAGLENTEWTNDKTATYNIGYISDVNQRFRTAHAADGTHKDKSINTQAMAIGTSANELNGSVLPSGKAVTVSGQSVGATTAVADVINIICQKVTDIWDKYLKNGNYQLNGEVAISDVVGDTGLTKAIKVGAAGDGTGYIKLADKVVLTFTGGSIRASADYVATDPLDLVTKTITDDIKIIITKLRQEFESFVASIGSSLEYSNTLLSRYKVDPTTIQAVSTANIDTLSGRQIVDGVSLETGYPVLLVGQNNKAENGLWEVQTGAWNRLPAQNSADTYRYKYFSSQNGTNKGKLYYCPSELTTYTPDVTPFSFYEANVAVAPIQNTMVMRDSSGRISDFDAFKKEVLLDAHPVGSLYWSSKPTNPAELFGGTWKQIKDRFIYAKGDSSTADSTGGASSVTLTEGNLPAHTHSFTPAGSIKMNSHTHSFTPSGSIKMNGHTHGLNSHTHSFSATTGSGGSHKHNVEVYNSASGGGKDWRRFPPSYDGEQNTYGSNSYSDTGYIQSAGSHTHTVSGTTGANSGNTASTTSTGSFTGTAGTTGGTTSTGSFTGTAGTTGSKGSGQAVSIMPPYVVKYCWERTA